MEKESYSIIKEMFPLLSDEDVEKHLESARQAFDNCMTTDESGVRTITLRNKLKKN